MTEPASSPLVILGLKVGDAPSIERWAREGWVPTIGSIMERGCHGRLAGPDRVCEHGSATTLFTGLPADRHGHYYFRQLIPGTYRLAPFGAGQVTARPFWARPEIFGGTVAVIDVPETRAAPGVMGSQLSNWSFHQSGLSYAPASAEPPELLAEVKRLFGAPLALPDFIAGASPDQDRRTLDHLLESVRTKGRICRHVLSRQIPDLVVATFDESHSASHQFWRYRPEAVGDGAAHGPSELRDGIRSVYQAIDREMGSLLEQIGDPSNVVIYSLFGMQDQFPAEGLNEALCRALGYQVTRVSRPGRARPIDLARRVVPERWRAALARYLPSGSQESLLADLLANGTDWGRTIAFSIPSLYTGFIRVNLRGREPQGIVAPEDYEAVLTRIEADLRQLAHPDTGEPAIDSIVRASDAFGGDPPHALPDLFVEWRAPTLLDRVRHPRALLTQPRPSFCPGSEERPIGFLAASGPGVRGRGDLGDVALTDLTATFLALAGARSQPAEMPGRPIRRLLEDGGEGARAR